MVRTLKTNINHLACAYVTKWRSVISTIADIALYPWAEDAESLGIDIERFPRLTAWYNRMNERHAVQKGMRV
jgi:hypothetical protein